MRFFGFGERKNSAAAANRSAFVKPTFSRQHFASLDALFSFIAETYQADDCRQPRWDRLEPHAYPNTPRFLYRGEEDVFIQMLSSEQRYIRETPETLRNVLGPRLRELYSEIGFQISDPGSMLNASDMAAARFAPHLRPQGPGASDNIVRRIVFALLQHYGLPSPGVDFSRNPWIAAAFASLGRVEGIGAFAILDVERMMRLGLAYHDGVHEYRAWRLMRQEACWISPLNNALDFKDPVYGEALHWYTFDHGPDPRLPADIKDFLYFDCGDKFTDYLCRQMNVMPRLPPEAAAYFAERFGSGLNVMNLI